MKYFIKIIFLIVVALYANIAPAEIDTPKLDASKPADNVAQNSTSSRIRLFGQNGFGVTLYKNSACEGGDDSVRVSGGVGSTFGSFLGTISNDSIGIPETEATKNLSQRSGLLSKAYYKEYKIDSGKPVTISMGFGDASGLRCRGKFSVAFVPEFGADYEGRLDLDFKEKTCRLVIQQVFADGVTGNVELSRPQACK